MARFVGFCGDVTVAPTLHNNPTVEGASVIRSRHRDTLVAHVEAALLLARQDGRRAKALQITRHTSAYSSLDFFFTCKVLYGPRAA